MNKKTIISLLLSCGLIIPIIAQDSLPFVDYSDKLLLRLYTVSKFNTLSILNKEFGKSLDFLPNGNTNIGIGGNYKKFGLGLAFGLPPSSDKERRLGKTQRFDLQASMFGKEIGLDGFLQFYKGYYNSNPEDFITPNSDVFPQIASLQILSIGISGFYFFNSNAYSYRAAFVRDVVQQKSGGSFLLGVFGNYDDSLTEDGYIPEQFPDSLRTAIPIKSFKNLAIGVSTGYAHNFIVNRRFLLGVFIAPGFGYQRVETTELDGRGQKEDQPAAQILTKMSLGYEFKAFYLGITGSINFRSIDLSPYDFDLSTQQFRFIIGRRFDM